jgi:hypothetical protein
VKLGTAGFGRDKNPAKGFAFEIFVRSKKLLNSRRFAARGDSKRQEPEKQFRMRLSSY